MSYNDSKKGTAQSGVLFSTIVFLLWRKNILFGDAFVKGWAVAEHTPGES